MLNQPIGEDVTVHKEKALDLVPLAVVASLTFHVVGGEANQRKDKSRT